MSLNVKTITLKDGAEVTLRLTSKALCAYNAKHGVEGAPLIANILNATDDLEARIALLTGALRYPDNQNTVKEGDSLLDLLADSGWGREDITGLIVELAELAGLISGGEAVDMQMAICKSSSKTLTSLVDFLNGKTTEVPEQKPPDTAQEGENPT